MESTKKPLKAAKLVVGAIKSLRAKQGFTHKEIKNFITSNHEVNERMVKSILPALKRGIDYGILHSEKGRYALRLVPTTTAVSTRKSKTNYLDGCGCKRQKSPSRSRCGVKRRRSHRRRKSRRSRCGHRRRTKRRLHRRRSSRRRCGSKRRRMSRRRRSRRSGRRCGGSRRRHARRHRRTRRRHAKCRC